MRRLVIASAALVGLVGSLGAAIVLPASATTKTAQVTWGYYRTYLDCYYEGEYLHEQGFYKVTLCDDTHNGTQTPWRLEVHN